MGAFGDLLNGGVQGVRVGEGGGIDAVALGNQVGERLGGGILLGRHWWWLLTRVVETTLMVSSLLNSVELCFCLLAERVCG